MRLCQPDTPKSTVDKPAKPAKAPITGSSCWPIRPGLCCPLDQLAASVPGLICSFRLRPDGIAAMPYASPAIIDILGLSNDEVAEDATPMLSRVHPDDIDRVMNAVRESASTMTQWHAEWRYLHPKLGERWIEGRSMPVQGPDGSVIWHGYVHDVTERKEREYHIAELNAFLQLLTNAVPALISYIDASLHYRTVNHAYERWFGTPASSIEGRPVREVLGKAVLKKLTPYLRRALAGETLEFEIELPYKRIGKRWVHISYLPDIDENGRVRGIVTMVVDLSEHQRIEDELRRSRKQFAELMAQQDDIRDAERRHVAREVHDELGQLLTGMRLTVSALLLKGEMKKQGVQQTASQLIKMLDQTSDVVRRISFSLRATVVEHGLLPALEGLAADFHDLTGITCRLTASGQAPQIDANRAMSVYRIVQESLTNIVRHARATTVSIHLHCTENHLLLTVQDDGIGFDFKATRLTGDGLGLFGMQERAVIAGGKLHITSSAGKGTQLELDLPLNNKVNK